MIYLARIPYKHINVSTKTYLYNSLFTFAMSFLEFTVLQNAVFRTLSGL